MNYGRNSVPDVDDEAPLKNIARQLEHLGIRLGEHATRNAKSSPSFPSGGPSAAEGKFARRLAQARRQRKARLGYDGFGEPAWDILLDMFAAHEESGRVSISSLCIAADVPPTTALRWINGMVAEGILIRVPDPSDRRRNWIRLAPEMVEKMRTLLSLMRGELV